MEARTEMLRGAFLAGTALSNVAMALHYGLCHVMGGTSGVPHCIANSFIFPHVLRFNLDSTAPQRAPSADVMGISLTDQSLGSAVEEAIHRIYDMFGSMNLPQHLHDV